MTWLTWRQYRLQGAIALTLLAAFAAAMLICGFQMAAAWHSGSPRQVWRPLCLRTASYLTRFQCLIVDFLALFRRHIAAV